VSADRTEQPELAQMKYSHAWIRFADVDATDGRVRVRNGYRFTDTSDVAIRWRLTQGGRTLAKGVEDPVLEPGESTVLDLDLPPVRGKTERWLSLDAVLTEPTSWAPAGHSLATEQLAAGGSKPPGPPAPPATKRLRLDTGGDRIELSGPGFSYVFDRSDGTFTRMRADGQDLIERGPRLDVWRAPIGNEWANWGEAEGRRFWAIGLDRLETIVEGVAVKRTGPRTARIVADIRSASPSVAGQGFTERYVYAVDSAGTVRIRQRAEAYGDQMRSLPWLPRVGIALEMPEDYATFTWYGRGPGESYPDRKDAEHVGLWSGDVDDQAFDYLPPQDTGNKTDTTWAAVRDGGFGLLAVGDDLDVSVDRYARERDRANYPFLLRDDGVVTFRIDKGVSGVGDTPNPTQPQYRVRPDVVHHHTVVLRPVR
jgi:beta-galactosidase